MYNGGIWQKRGRAQIFDTLEFLCYLKKWYFCEMLILVVFNSFNVVQNLKNPDSVARQIPPLYTTNMYLIKTKYLLIMEFYLTVF